MATDPGEAESRAQPVPWKALASAVSDEELAAVLHGRPLSGVESAALVPVSLVLQLFSSLGILFGLSGAATLPAQRRMQRNWNERYPENLPGMTDLVRFELREVFREADRAAQLTPPPSDEFRKWARAQGYDPYWADSYWAAHWELPSPTQGYEMFHRLRRGRVPDGLVFGEAELRSLLRKLDILPAYHDRLTAVAYAPLTRVDVRRMRRLGVLSRDEVREAFQDLGYDATNAQLLADFTERDAESHEQAISASLLNDAYLDGLLTRDEFADRMKRMGREVAAVELTLEVLDRRLTDREVKKAAAKERTLNALRRRAIKDMEDGKIDQGEYDDQLAALELTPAELRAFWDGIVAAPRVRELSVGQVLKALRDGALDADAARARIVKLGYRPDDADVLLRSDAARAKAKDREFTTAQLLRFLRGGVLSADEVRARLQAMGWDQAEAALLVLSEELRGEQAAARRA